MEAVKSIDELYEEVKDYDLVLCNDAPLATALNNRVNRAMLGHFAVTPRQLAASLCMELTGEPIIDDIRLVKKVSDDTGYSLRYVHGEIENFKAAVRFTSEPRMGRKARRVWEAYNRYNTLDRLMRTKGTLISESLKGKKVAAIGLQMFDELDKQVNPTGVDDIEMLDDLREFEIPSMRVLGNDRLIAECAADLAGRCDPNDVAIVIDTTGPMADAVKSALYRMDMPFINSLNMRDISAVRMFLEFIQLALSFETVRVRDVREIVSAYGGSIWSKYDKYYLSKFFRSGIKRSNRTDDILKIMATVGDHTFEEVSTLVPSDERSSVTMLLDQMECDDKPVTQDLLDDLTYVVNSINSLTHNEQISKDEKKGVLLVDCKNSVYIDRPVVIYTGMCAEWETDLNALDYIDPNKRPDIEGIYNTRFKALIQQGSVRFYLVNATKGGEDAVPCKYFDACMRLKPSAEDYGHLTEKEKEKAKPIKLFRQVTENLIEGPWRIDWKDRSSRSELAPMEPELPEVFSNSSYLKFLTCPKQYMLYKLSDSPDNSNTFTGNRLHEYAEFRVSYPDIAKENGTKFYADMIADECAPLNSPDLEDIERCKIQSAVEAIDGLIEGMNVIPGEMVERSSEKKEGNMFLEYHGLTEVSERSEVSLTSKEDRLHGIIDLLWDGMAIDFKTGSPKSTGDLVKKYDIISLQEDGKGNKYSDAQALFYIALLEDCGVDNRKVFQLFYAQQAYEQRLSGRPVDLDACKRTVRLEETYEDVMRNHLPNLLSAKDYVDAELSLMGFYRECADRWGPDPSSWDENDPYAEEMAIAHDLIISRGKNKGKPKTELISKAARKYKTAFSRNIIASEVPGTVVILRSTLERFKEGLREKLEELRKCYREGFPEKPVIKCRDCEFRDLCIVEADGGEDCDEAESE